jgi:hypothetical protein
VYRKSGESGPEALCIEHFDEEVDWEVIDKSDPDGECLAYVRGGCALEDCCLRKWRVNGVYGVYVKRSSVKLVTGEEARSKASDRASFASECTPSLPSIVSIVSYL